MIRPIRLARCRVAHWTQALARRSGRAHHRRSGWLGKALSLACARAGATVVMHGRVVRKLEALYDEIMAAKLPEPIILPLDLARAEAADFANVASALDAQLGRLDALVHTAALLGSLGPLEHQSFDNWLALLRVNVAAPMGLTRIVDAAARARARRERRVHARQPRPGAARVLGRLCRDEGGDRRARA